MSKVRGRKGGEGREDLNVQFFVALAAGEGLLALGVLAAVVAAELVEADEGLAALGAVQGDLLVVEGLVGGGLRRGQRGHAVLIQGAAGRVMRLVVHLHGLRVLERLVAPLQPAPPRPPVLDQLHRHLRRLHPVVRRLVLLQPLHTTHTTTYFHQPHSLSTSTITTS